MSDSESSSMSLEALGEFFLPVIEAYKKNVEVALSQSKDKDLSDAEWKIISEDSRMGILAKSHAIVDSWEQFDLFFSRKSKLYGFIEEKQSGLVQIDYVLWVFFSPATATSFFNHLLERPKNFSTKAIVTLPFIKLLEPLTEKVDNLLADGNVRASEQITKTLEILEIAERYLNDGDITILDAQIKKSVLKPILAETNQLLKDVNNKAASAFLLVKRLKSLFKIGWRYLRAKNELETRYFKKLLSEDPTEREKGLKLTHKKALDLKKGSSG